MGQSLPPNYDNTLLICADISTPHPPLTTSDNPVFSCAYVDMCIFGTLTAKKKHKCTRGCGGYLHGDFCAVQDDNNRCLNNIALMNHMCQKCA